MYVNSSVTNVMRKLIGCLYVMIMALHYTCSCSDLALPRRKTKRFKRNSFSAADDKNNNNLLSEKLIIARRIILLDNSRITYA